MPRVIAIVGATATGKSALAMTLARRLGGEIINADALQVYRGLDLGTAKPTLEERQEVRHHLIDILEPTQPYSAGEFARRARSAIDEVQERGGPALVVGGSGLYLRALFQGLSPLPQTSPRVRQELRRRLAAEGLASLYAELTRLDPVTATRLAANDTQRVLRALEVVTESGVPISQWQERPPSEAPPADVQRIGLTLPRPILYDRIGSRVRRLVEQGWVAEVERLLSKRFPLSSPAFQAIGYRQLIRCIGGELMLTEAVEEIIRATRRYAKRQQTWFRREPAVTWFDARQLERRIPSIVDHLN